MTPAAKQLPWRKALVLGALLAVVAGVVIGTWFRPAATTPPAAVASNTTPREAPPPTPLPVQVTPNPGSAAPASEPAPNTDVTPIAPVAPGDASDLSRLRARDLTLPVTGVKAALLSNTFAQARAAGVPHEALDIMAARGTPVLAVEDGRVAKLFLSKPGGITLYQFDPGSEYAYYYAHLDGYADGIAEGTNLRKGQVIGYVGSSGNASPDAPHLHFAVLKLEAQKQWWRGTPINPFLLWRDAKP